MVNYAANCPISGPIKVDFLPDVNFGGMSFNYQYGLMFHVVDEEPPIRPPAQILDL